MVAIREVQKDDLSIISTYVLDEAKANGVSLPPTNVLRHLEFIIDELGGVVVELDGKIIGFALWEITRENWLVSFYIADGYRKRREVISKIYKAILDKFKGQVLKYKPLHKGINELRYCVNGVIDLESAEKALEKLI
jgi:hypothetical protein